MSLVVRKHAYVPDEKFIGILERIGCDTRDFSYIEVIVMEEVTIVPDDIIAYEETQHAISFLGYFREPKADEDFSAAYAESGVHGVAELLKIADYFILQGIIINDKYGAFDYFGAGKTCGTYTRNPTNENWLLVKAIGWTEHLFTNMTGMCRDEPTLPHDITKYYFRENPL